VNQTQTENLPKIQIYYKTSEFDELFLLAIDQTFSKVLGNSAKQVFFSFLENKIKLSKQDLPNRVADFVYGLEQIFGTSASLLELEVMKTLRQSIPSFNYSPLSSDLSFEPYVESLRQHLENF
jgi:hypothetical protein